MNTGFSVHLRKHVKGFELDVSWTTGMGFTSLVGYSGSGKSLTLAMLMGTLRPDEGWITFDGRTLYDGSARVHVPPQRRGFGFVSQSGDLFPHLTVRSNVAYGLRDMGRRQRDRRTDELLEAFHIAELADRLPSETSGGQRQRIALARALAPQPQALLLDEPLSALDLPIRCELRTLLRSIHEQFAIPVVMVTHDVREACELSDTLVVYSGTGVVQVGPPAELVEEPQTPEIARLMHSVPLPDGFADRRPRLRVIQGGLADTVAGRALL